MAGTTEMEGRMPFAGFPARQACLLWLTAPLISASAELLTCPRVAAYSDQSPVQPTESTQLVTPSLVPTVTALLKPGWLKRLTEDHEILVNASLTDFPGTKSKTYAFYSTVQVRASLPFTRKILTDYEIYSKIIPYVDRTAYDLKRQVLFIQGGIWNFKLRSQIRFKEITERWIQYEIIGGHFSGLVGEILLEPLGENGTLVYLKGEQSGEHWPPRFVIERGAEVVFEFAARRMRSYIETQKKNSHKKVP